MRERSQDWNDGYEVGYRDGENDGYEVGYRDGESSANADWFLVLSEAFYDMTPEMGPKAFVEMLYEKGTAEK